MWRLKQLIPKEQTGLEGRTVEVGSLKLQIRSTIAQGGFSCVYLARDAQSGKQYAVKHVICNDTESLDLVKKEVAVMKALRGHPNVVTLHSQSMYDMGRTKECFLVMEYCEKMLVNVLDSRGAGYFEEIQLLLMFRDICNAVYAMHSQSPPIAHRDLKAENVLLGNDGQWKLCDFGSTSTNHKRFEKADEMGIEEDIIRKHTTPAYRAPEMWDLYRRELISEKVDIWALGCLLYRIAYLKSAFDGESKLQILNGNYRLPDLPKYSANVSDLINDLLNSSPEARPDVMQVWRRVNGSLPSECRKIGPDRSPSTLPSQPHARDTHDARNPVQTRQSSVMPTRAPPPPPPGDSDHRTPAPKEIDHRSSQNVGKSAAPLGAFWSTHYAQEAQYDDDAPVKDKASNSSNPPEFLPKSPDLHGTLLDSSPISEHHSVRGNFLKKSGVTNLMKKVHDSLHQSGSHAREDDETRLDDDDVHDKKDPISSTGLPLKSARPSTDEAFSAFVAELQNATDLIVENKAASGDSTQVELENLKKELKQIQSEKKDIVSKYEKLTAICRSQRLEIQELKSALATANNQNVTSQMKETPSQVRTISSQSSQAQVTQQQRHLPSAVGWQSPEQKSDRHVGSIWDLQEGLSLGSSKRGLVSGSQGWRAFGDTTGSQIAPKQSSIIKESNQDLTSEFDSTRVGGSRFDSPKIGATNGNNKRQPHSRAASFAGGDAWGLHDSFSSFGAGLESAKGMGQSIPAEAAIGSTTGCEANSSKGENWSSHPASHSQPAGWAGF